MKYTIGIISDNNELVEDITENSQENKFINYKTIESIKKEEFSLLFVDCDIFDTLDMNKEISICISDHIFDPDGNDISLQTIFAGPDHGTIEVDYETMVILYTPFEGYTGYDSFCYGVCDDGSPVLCDSAYVYLEVLPETALIFYNTLTPNGDGKNDLFIIGNINEFPENDLVIVNQWGDEMASYNGYNNFSNVWDCRNKDGMIVPYGTYYYVLTLRNKDKVYRGWIYVHGSY